jgi:arsenate reductase-like glutaredoxin family protein
MASHGVSAKEIVDAKKVRMDEAPALKVARLATTLLVAKGKTVKRSSVKGMNDEELLGLVMGPTGNLRAPTIRRKGLLVVGFNEELYSEVFSD